MVENLDGGTDVCVDNYMEDEWCSRISSYFTDRIVCLRLESSLRFAHENGQVIEQFTSDQKEIMAIAHVENDAFSISETADLPASPFIIHQIFHCLMYRTNWMILTNGMI